MERWTLPLHDPARQHEDVVDALEELDIALVASCSEFDESAMASKLSVRSPTTGWCSRFTPVRWNRTLCAAQRRRKSALHVESSPMWSCRFWSAHDGQRCG